MRKQRLRFEGIEAIEHLKIPDFEHINIYLVKVSYIADSNSANYSIGNVQ